MKKMILASLVLLTSFYSASAQELHVAAGQGDLEKVKRILEKDPSQLNMGYGYGAPIHYAARRGHKDVVNYLIKKGADVNLKFGDTSPLFHAAYKEHKDVVETLMLNGAEIGFFEAIACGYRGLVVQMISEGKNIGQFNNSGIHPLCRAARFGNNETVYYFIENGIDINMKERRGSNLLHNAAFGGQFELVKYLVDLGVDINAKTENGETPLDYALYNGHQKVAKFLKEKGALSTVNIKPKLTKISNNVYAVFFDGADSNVGIIFGPQGAILIDSGGGFRIGEILNEIAEKDLETSIKYVINTHIDWDHNGGNTFFEGKSTIINIFNLEEMENKGIISGSSNRLNSSYEEIFGKYYKMRFNDEEIFLIPAPGTHSASDMLIYFSGSNVLFTGDFLLSTRFQRENKTRDEYVERIKKGVERRINTENYIPPYPYDIEVMEAITEICPSTTTCVGGHWSIFSMKEVEGYLSLIKKLYSEALEK
jgi:ankyrin repeat protein